MVNIGSSLGTHYGVNRYQSLNQEEPGNVSLFQNVSKNGFTNAVSSTSKPEKPTSANDGTKTTNPVFEDTFTKTSQEQKEVPNTYSRKDIANNAKNAMSNAISTNSNSQTSNSDNSSNTAIRQEASNNTSSRAVDSNNEPENSTISTDDKKTDDGKEKNERAANGKELTEEETQKIEQLKARDSEVRVHENQHKSVGGQYAQAPSYTYEKGPDGKSYVTDGEVQISISEESTPEKTISKMQQVRKAALAPAEPSGADRNVANQAQQIINKAQQELYSSTSQDNSEQENEDSKDANKEEASSKKTESTPVNKEQASNSISDTTTTTSSASDDLGKSSSQSHSTSNKTDQSSNAMRNRVSSTYQNSYKSMDIAQASYSLVA